MANNLQDYTKAQLINIAEQLTIPNAGLTNSKNSTLITKIQDMAEELGVSVPNPEVLIETTVTKVSGASNATKRIQDHGRVKISVEARDESIKEQVVRVNGYRAKIVIGEEVMVPEPIATLLESLKSTIHSVDSNGNVAPKDVSRFYVKRLK